MWPTSIEIFFRDVQDVQIFEHPSSNQSLCNNFAKVIYLIMFPKNIPCRKQEGQKE